MTSSSPECALLAGSVNFQAVSELENNDGHFSYLLRARCLSNIISFNAL